MNKEELHEVQTNKELNKKKPTACELLCAAITFFGGFYLATVVLPVYEKYGLALFAISVLVVIICLVLQKASILMWLSSAGMTFALYGVALIVNALEITKFDETVLVFISLHYSGSVLVSTPLTLFLNYCRKNDGETEVTSVFEGSERDEQSI